MGDYSLRQLELLTDIKAELSKALNHCIDVGLVARDRHTQRSLVSRKALLGFLLQGIKYVFPVKPAALVRGMPTIFNVDYFLVCLVKINTEILFYCDSGHTPAMIP